MIISKRILIFGASGFIGKCLKEYLEFLGHDVVSISRKPREGMLCFDFQELPHDLKPFECSDVWIQLSGESIQGRWTAAKKNKILKSRVNASIALKKLAHALKYPPEKVLIATGAGYYGNQGAKEITESSPKGEFFLSDVVAAVEKVWEDAPFKTVMMRFAAVLDLNGGALKKLLIPFRFFQICYYGNSQFYFPWISLNELIRMISFIIEKEDITGPVNFSTQFPTTQRKLFDAISKCFYPILRWTIPKKIIELLMGQMGKELLLIDQKILPQKLMQHGYVFNESDPLAVLMRSLKFKNSER